MFRGPAIDQWSGIFLFHPSINYQINNNSLNIEHHKMIESSSARSSLSIIDHFWGSEASQGPQESTLNLLVPHDPVVGSSVPGAGVECCSCEIVKTSTNSSSSNSSLEVTITTSSEQSKYSVVLWLRKCGCKNISHLNCKKIFHIQIVQKYFIFKLFKNISHLI